jgi:hypothetical protein
MNPKYMGTATVLACVLTAAQAQADTATTIGRLGGMTAPPAGMTTANGVIDRGALVMQGGGTPTPGGSIGGAAGFGTGSLTGVSGIAGKCGVSGYTGLCGCCGGIGAMCGVMGFTGMGGCCGGMTGMYGCLGCYPSYPLYGAFLSTSSQTYAPWKASPNKAYYHRTTQVYAPAPNDISFEFVIVYYPERPKYFYFFDPAEKKYIGQYQLGARPEKCFSLLNPNERKASLRDVSTALFRNPGPMPSLQQTFRPSGAIIGDSNALKDIKLQRPPESIPDDLLGLPPEEALEKKKK